MNVLVVNAGSSSLKYQLFDTSTDTVIAKGVCERIGIDGRIKHTRLLPSVAEFVQDIAMPNHTVATKCVVDALLSSEHGCVSSMDEIEAVGHRVVHGGAFFSQSVKLTDDVLAKLEQCYDFAPLHTPAHIQGIKGCLGIMPNTPQVLVFDTAFHQTMPKEAYMYGLSYDMYEQYGIRRYGAHGTSHRYVAGEMAKLLGKPVEETCIVTCHVGNGSSITAVKGGKCIDTSMGFTPLAGVLMGTRCGDIDPAIVPYIMNKKGFTPDEVADYMNKQCGLLGISGVGSDCRDVEAAINEGNERAKLAFDMLAYEIKKYIGAYSAAMGGLDAIVFTAGVGENNPYIRRGACSGLEYLGVALDETANENAFGRNGRTRISADDSRVQIWMLPTNEELVIARDTAEIAKQA